MQLTNRAYDKVKFVALVLLPALASAYFALEQVWGLPHSEKVVGTLAVIDTLLGLLLKNSSTNYRAAGGTSTGEMTDGDLVLQQDEGQVYMGLAVNKETMPLLQSKEAVTFRVVDRTQNGPPQFGG